MTTPKGVKFVNNPNNIEYQVFSEEYFSGSDITIYFGDVFVSEISGLEFILQEKVLPIFGYASKTFDATARGTRIVQGSFRVPFREAGYMSTIMTHLGEITTSTTKAKPELGYIMGGKEADLPAWNADVKETIEELLNRQSNADLFKGKFPIGPGHKGKHVSIVRRLLTKVMGASDQVFGDTNGFGAYIKTTYGALTLENCKKMSDTIYLHDKLGNSNTGAIKTMQARITYILDGMTPDMRRFATKKDFNGMALMPLHPDGIIDTRTSKGMELFCTLFKFTEALAELKANASTSKEYANQPLYLRMPAMALYALGKSQMAGYEDTFGVDLFSATAAWQKKDGLKITGEIDEAI